MGARAIIDNKAKQRVFDGNFDGNKRTRIFRGRAFPSYPGIVG